MCQLAETFLTRRRPVLFSRDVMIVGLLKMGSACFQALVSELGQLKLAGVSEMLVVNR